MGLGIFKRIYHCTLGRIITWYVKVRDQNRGLDFAREVSTKDGIKCGALQQQGYDILYGNILEIRLQKVIQSLI